MALPVRPAITPTAQVAPRVDAGRLAAQKAFFQAALAKAEPTAAPAQTVGAQAAAAPPVQPQASVRAAAPSEEPAKKIPRPGTYLDIRV